MEEYAGEPEELTVLSHTLISHHYAHSKDAVFHNRRSGKEKHLRVVQAETDDGERIVGMELNASELKVRKLVLSRVLLCPSLTSAPLLLSIAAAAVDGGDLWP